MQNRPKKPEPDVLPTKVAERLLARAAELDAANSAVARLSDLRAAAGEAGISAPAFDAALAELQDAEESTAVEVQQRPLRRTRLFAVLGTGTAVVLGLFVFFMSVVVPARVEVPGVPRMFEETISLRCVPPNDAGAAAALIAPIVMPEGAVVNPAAGRTLRVRATPEKMQRVKTVLEQLEGASPSCSTP